MDALSNTAPGDATLRRYNTIALTRRDRLLTITLNRPESRNAINLELHEELAEVFVFAAADPHSDVIVLTGAGSAFSAGGDLEHIVRNAANPELFDEEVRLAKRIVFAMLDLDKPLVCRMNGHAVGLGATLALFCDVIFAADNAKIGVKFTVALIVFVLTMVNMRKERIPNGLFWGLLGLTLLNMGVAVFW